MESWTTSVCSEKSMIGFNPKCTYDISPKLHKTNRIENRKLVSYQTAVKDALFGKTCLPYMPTEPPAPISEEIVESDPLYVCKHCKDCFRFQNSFEDHNKRRSWVLGFLCRSCFVTVCTHITKTGSACPICMKKDNDKRFYLRRRGLPRYQKPGVAKVFYNQCQFWEHVEMHGSNTVDMGDVMLMPLSANMCESDWLPQVEIICEALMERSFLSRMHIMDWLKIYNLEDNWWKLVNGKSNNNVISKIVEGYRGRQLFKIFEKSTVNEFTNFNSSDNVYNSKNSLYIEFTDDSVKNKDANNYSVNKIADKNVSENEDNPCMSTDIAFVDCGPTSQYLEPESSVSYVPIRRVKVVTKSAHSSNKSLTNMVRINNKKKIATCKDLHSLETDVTSENTIAVKTDKSSNKNFVIRQSSKDCAQQCRIVELFGKKVAKNSINKSIIETDINKILDNPVKIPISNEKILPKILPKANSNHLEQGKISNSSSKVLLKILPKTKSEQLEQDQTSNTNSKILSVQSSQNVGNKIILPNTNLNNLEQGLQTSKNNNSKMLSVESSQNADITSIISQLPSHLISNKKLIVVGQDSSNVIAYDKNEVSTEKRLSTSLLDNSNVTDNYMSSQKKICNSVNINKPEQILIKNGKKYFIKHQKYITKDTKNSSNLPVVNSTTKIIKQPASEHNMPMSTSTNSSKAENIDVEQMALVSNDISTPSFTDLCLTPSPSPSESSSNSGWIYESYITKNMYKGLSPQLITSSIIQKKNLFETISLTEKNGNIYMHIKIVDRISKEGFRDTFEVIPKYREQMIDEFHQLNSFELKERINHLKLVSEEMRKVLDFLSSNVLWEKSRSINTLQHILEKCLDNCNQDVTDKKNDDAILNEWESEILKKKYPNKCSLCDKIVKPLSYIPGFSRLPKDDNIYCSCYKLVCHECLSYQDNVSQFTAHQNYHKNCEPYVCPNCQSKFASMRSLEVHTWTVCFHTLKKFILSCKICEIDGFRDMESITRHIAIMHSTTKIACEICSKVLSSYSEYVKHSTETHVSVLSRNPIRLVKCRLGNVIIRFENLMWYTEMHPAIRKLIWFKCPFCPLITVENKYTTAILNDHLRNKHFHHLSEILSKEALVDIFGTAFLKADVNTVSENLVDTFTNEAAKHTIIPRIVNARTISSEIFEHGTEDEISLWKYDNSNVAWSRIEIKPSTMENVNDGQKIISLPKILNVKSMNDLKSFKPKEVVIKTSIEAKEKSNSQSSQAEIIIDEKNDPLAGEDAKEMELDDSKSDNKEKKGKTKESKKTNNESIISTDIHNVRVISPTESCKRILDSKFMSKTSIDGHIKVVDIRKICKPNIEPFVTTEPNSTLTEDENIMFIPQPPPLAKIPQYLFKSVEVYKLGNGSKNVAKTTKFLPRRAHNKTIGRIAIHGTTGAEEINVDYLCHLCGEQINTSKFVVHTHFREKHSHECRLAAITPRLMRISPDFINGGYKQFINSRKRKADSALLVSKRKRRWTPKKHTETKDASAPVGLCVERETAEDGEGNFKCKKCDQRCTDMSNLREHIATNHRLKGRYLICLECGENFVVAPSLQMHLKAFHGIENPINYMNQNPSYAPGIDDDSEVTGKTTVANQCYVCMAVFEDKAAVDKHLRVHGMAFLNRKRIEARNALKSPEKKANMEEENIAKSSPKEMVKQDKPAEIILEKINVAM
ncbi:uncharacterized protein [Polyergus mexicanus]|uniref:uncharacterized protein isoform X2 n=1 Tax=Polyergus mexicanus TaxID=615972 RepID=UPI0038B607EC